jgi:hypothetical protein
VHDGDLAALASALAAGADLESADSFGDTALMLSAREAMWPICCTAVWC